MTEALKFHGFSELNEQEMVSLDGGVVDWVAVGAICATIIVVATVITASYEVGEVIGETIYRWSH